jgi:hypothetical protein
VARTGKFEKVLRQRPFLCRFFFLSALTWFGIYLLVFIALLLFSGRLAEIFSWYAQPGVPGKIDIRLFAGAGTFLYLIVFSGLVIMYSRRPWGLSIFIPGLIALMALDFSFMNFDWLRYLVNSGFAFLVGILHFSRGCYKKLPVKEDTGRAEALD